MDKTALQAFILLTISEYGALNSAFHAEAMLVNLFAQMNDQQMKDYQECANLLNDFNNLYMHTLTGKFPTE